MSGVGRRHNASIAPLPPVRATALRCIFLLRRDRSAATIRPNASPGGPSSPVATIVARSGVAKSTIYRHWDTRDDVLVDVLASSKPDLPDPGPEVPS